MRNSLKQTKRGLTVSLLALVVTLFLLGSQGAQAASWKVVASPNPGTSFNLLQGVAAVSAKDVWAVGAYANTTGPIAALIEHWNGTAWKVVSHPNPGTSQNWLSGVAAVSSTNLWAVGIYLNINGPLQTLIEHWNGRCWKVVANPNPGTRSSSLNGVAAVSAKDVWAVGAYANGNGPSRTLIEHWNGTAWKVVASPAPGTRSSSLNGVAAISAKDVWAVGTYANQNGPVRTLIEHWNGTAWKVVASPSPGSDDDFLKGVAAVSSTNLWAVGTYANQNGSSRTLIEHWNGISWQVVSSPSPGAVSNSLSGAAAVNATNLWAVGVYQNSINSNRTLIEHWNGTSWNVVGSPNGGTSLNDLNGVAAVSSTNLWAVGIYSNMNSSTQRTLIEEYS